jgi:hypothetical protein
VRRREFLFGGVAAAWSLGDLIDLMKGFSLSSAQDLGGAWQIPPYMAPADAFDERYRRG